MAELPTGTVTFLFTDVEGSTRLLHELGDDYAAVLAEHRRVLRDAFGRHGGVEVDTQGDAFFVAFAKASDALAAAAEARDALEGASIRVRMGIHTGEPLVTEEGYVGIDVHRAARIAAAGHGGQILVSRSTRELVGDNGLRDLGEHRLKDLSAAERIYQLGHDDFPPLKSLGATNLPIASSRLVGRVRELAELTALLARSERLLTLLGPGGTGKTRLALEVAAQLVEDFPGGVFFVPLSGVREPALVEPTIAAALGLHDLAELGDRRVLLVIDNFEHLLSAAPTVSAVLGAGSQTRVLATSRAPLRVRGEVEYLIEPLPLEDALTLLTERARAVRTSFVPDDAAQEICRRLDGLPLAVELAAPHLRSLGSAALLERLDRRLPLLTKGARDAPARQQTLRAAIEWSYDLLPPSRQRSFQRLAVLAGTFSLEAAGTVAQAPLDDVDGLVETSMLKALPQDRYLMLETVREYASELLSEEERVFVRERHAAYFARFAETAAAQIDGGESSVWVDLVDADLDNMRAALAWAREFDPDARLRLAGALAMFWHARGLDREGDAQITEALAAAAPSGSAGARALHGAFTFRISRADFVGAAEFAQATLALARTLDDPLALRRGLQDVAMVAEERGDLDAAELHYRACLDVARQAERTHDQAIALNNLGSFLLRRGDIEQAGASLEECLALLPDSRSPPGDDLRVYVFLNLGRLAVRESRLRDALDLARRGAADAAVLRFPLGTVLALQLAAVVCASAGDLASAARLAGAAEAAREQSPGWVHSWSELEDIRPGLDGHPEELAAGRELSVADAFAAADAAVGASEGAPSLGT